MPSFFESFRGYRLSKFTALTTVVCVAATLQGCQDGGGLFPSFEKKTQDMRPPLHQRAGDLVQKWGKPRRMLLGLGGGSPVSSLQSQGISVDIYEHYLVGLGQANHSWEKWNSPSGAFVGLFAAQADQMGAVPMFTLYQMATWGDGNLSGLQDKNFMTLYWDNVRLMYRQIKAFGKPTLVNFEPDFWGYAQLDRGNQGTKVAKRQFAHVPSANPDCANLPDSVAGMGQCLVQMARALAPNAYIGFPPSMWGFASSDEIAFLKEVGAEKADFVVMQTLDRDAGCFEATYIEEDALCNRPSKEPYWWDATNQTTPSFASHFKQARQFHEGLGLPLVWWQTPLGVPTATPGGRRTVFRDNRAHYFLTKSQELVAVGAAAAVFSQGHTTQTNIDTDGGQFKRLSHGYLSAPTTLP